MQNEFENMNFPLLVNRAKPGDPEPELKFLEKSRDPKLPFDEAY